MNNELVKCSICGANLTRAWIGNVYEVVCSGSLYGQCNAEEKRRSQRDMLISKLERDGFLGNEK